jgi:hypothetical protein
VNIRALKKIAAQVHHKNKKTKKFVAGLKKGKPYFQCKFFYMCIEGRSNNPPIPPAHPLPAQCEATLHTQSERELKPAPYPQKKKTVKHI